MKLKSLLGGIFAKNREHNQTHPSFEMIVKMIANNPQACKEDQIPGAYGKFGYEPTNPIPVFGIFSNEIYLEKLRRINGGKISWKRIGSLQVSNINESIDNYGIYDEDEKLIATIYISPYHWKISELAPEGFYLAK